MVASSGGFGPLADTVLPSTGPWGGRGGSWGGPSRTHPGTQGPPQPGCCPLDTVACTRSTRSGPARGSPWPSGHSTRRGATHNRAGRRSACTCTCPGRKGHVRGCLCRRWGQGWHAHGCEWQRELGWGWWRGLHTWAANLREHRDSWADSGLETGSQSWAPCPYQRSTASADGSAWSCGRGSWYGGAGGGGDSGVVGHMSGEGIGDSRCAVAACWTAGATGHQPSTAWPHSFTKPLSPNTPMHNGPQPVGGIAAKSSKSRG